MMHDKRFRKALIPFAVMVLIVSVTSSGSLAQADDSAGSGCSAPPEANPVTAIGTVSTLRLWDYASYPVFAHVLPATSLDGATITGQTETLDAEQPSEGAELTELNYTTFGQTVQVDVVAAPPGAPQVWLGDYAWNSSQGDLNLMAYGSLSDGSANFQSCIGWR